MKYQTLALLHAYCRPADPYNSATPCAVHKQQEYICTSLLLYRSVYIGVFREWRAYPCCTSACRYVYTNEVFSSAPD